MKKEFDLLEHEGPSKVVPLDEAIRLFVRPGMSIHMAAGLSRPNALAFALARCFWGQESKFTLATSSPRENVLPLLYGGLVRRLIAPGFGPVHVFPTPGPNPVAQWVFAEGKVEWENWSLLTLSLRLLAGALKLPFFPTRSIAGSDMESENFDRFRVMEDPFTSERIGLVRALRPDLSLIHATACDRFGNAIIFPPYGEIWGSLAAEEGVIVSTERVVSTEVVRRQAAFVKIPGHRVKAVVHAPFGVHPGALYTGEIEGIGSYGEDKVFLLEYREACKKRDALEAWLSEWVLKPHEEYLRQLGKERLGCLVGNGQRSSWVGFRISEEDGNSPPTDAEEMCVLAARKIAEEVKQDGHRVILAGAGYAHLAAWLATYLLRQEGHKVELALEIGMLGSLPRPGDPYIFNLGNVYTATSLSDTLHILGVYVAGDRSLGVLGFAQIDRSGNINTTQYDGLLGGSGGANDVGSGATKVIAVGLASKNRLLERVEYVTTPGKHVTVLVTDRGILEKGGESGELIFTGFMAVENETEDTALEECRGACGWPLKATARSTRYPPCSQSELALLRGFDPDGFFLNGKGSNGKGTRQEGSASG